MIQLDGQRLRIRSSVHDLHNQLAILLVPRHHRIDPRAAIGQCALHHFSAHVACKQHLYPVARRAVTRQRVVADQVRRPLHAACIHVYKQRRIARHDDKVAVAFQARQPRRI